MCLSEYGVKLFLLCVVLKINYLEFNWIVWLRSKDTHWIHYEEVLVQGTLARLQLVTAHVLSPDAEGFPLAEQWEHGYLK